MNMLEVKLSNDLQGNFNEMKKWAEGLKKQYSTLVYTEENLSEAKNDRAAINKQIREIDARRINIKNAYMEEYKAFEDRVKEVTNILDETSKSIDKQVKDFEAKAANKKRVDIEVWWNNAVKNMFQGTVEISPSLIWKKEFLNKAYTEKKWTEELTDRLKEIRADLGTIANFDQECSEFVLPMYLTNLSISTCLQAYEDDKQAKQRAAKLQEQMNERRKQAEMKVEVQKPVAETFKPISNTYTEAYMTVKLTGELSLMHEVSNVIRNFKARGLQYVVIDSGKEEKTR